MKEQVLDSPDDLNAGFYGRDDFSYVVHNSGNLVIRLRFTKKDFFRKFRWFFILTGVSFLIPLFFIIRDIKNWEIILPWSFIIGVIFLIGVLPWAFFLLLKKVEWEFTSTALHIKNVAGRIKTYDRQAIKQVMIMKVSDVSSYNFTYFDIKYWIVLKVPDQVYEDGKLYLLIVQGVNSKNFVQDLAIEDQPFTGIEDTLALSRMIAAHWNIPGPFEGR